MRKKRTSIDSRLHRIVAAQPYPLLFATISGAHLYGFPSPDSDIDLRGAHVLPLEKVVGFEVHEETIEDSRVIEGMACRAEAGWRRLVRASGNAPELGTHLVRRGV